MVNESAGMVNLTVKLISGKLCGEVEINLNDNTINTTGTIADDIWILSTMAQE